MYQYPACTPRPAPSADRRSSRRSRGSAIVRHPAADAPSTTVCAPAAMATSSRCNALCARSPSRPLVESGSARGSASCAAGMKRSRRRGAVRTSAPNAASRSSSAIPTSGSDFVRRLARARSASELKAPKRTRASAARPSSSRLTRSSSSNAMAGDAGDAAATRRAICAAPPIDTPQKPITSWRCDWAALTRRKTVNVCAECNREKAGCERAPAEMLGRSGDAPSVR
jgi:hypothetical protein